MKALQIFPGRNLAQCFAEVSLFWEMQHFHFIILQDPFVFPTGLSTHFIGIPKFSTTAIHR